VHDVDRLLLVTNAAAGSTADDAVDSAVRVLGEAYDVEVARPGSIDDLDGVLAGRAGRPVMVVGGDGSLHAVVTVLQREHWLDDTRVGLVPLGTGNDFARGLDLPLDPVEAARAFLAGHERRLDVLVEDGGEVVVNAVHIGVGVDAAREASDLKPRFGRMSYVLGAFRAGFVSKGQRLRVVVDGEVVAFGRHHVFQVAVANGQFVGGGTPIAPDADPGDGEVDVVLSYALAPIKRAAYAVWVRLGRHEHRRDVAMYRGRRVEVTGPPFMWNVDGEIEGPEARRAWTLRVGVLRFVVPPASE